MASAASPEAVVTVASGTGPADRESRVPGGEEVLPRERDRYIDRQRSACLSVCLMTHN